VEQQWLIEAQVDLDLIIERAGALTVAELEGLIPEQAVIGRKG
jgi:hypothetical protein